MADSVESSRAAIEHAVEHGRAPFWWGSAVNLSASDSREVGTPSGQAGTLPGGVVIAFRLPRWLGLGRWTAELFNPDALFYWGWCEYGYDGLWDEYSFGFLLGLSYDTDYLLEAW